MSWNEALEYTAVLLGLCYVVLIARENVLGWLAGFAGAICSIVVLFDAQLYLDAALYGFYAFLTAYGWARWSRTESGEQKTDVPIRRISIQLGGVLLGVGAVATVLLGWMAAIHTDTDVPYWDAWTSSYSVLGTVMQAHKLFENWMLWIVVNSVYVGLYWYKGLMAFSSVSLLYIALAVYGHIQWRTKLLASSSG